MDVKLYVGNLSKSTTQEELNTLFKQAGDVGSVNIIKDRTSGESKGFAFVTMSAQSEADKAISMFNSYSLSEHELKVDLAKRIITMYHSANAAREAEAEFNRMFRDGGAPDDIPQFEMRDEGSGIALLSVLTDAKLAESRSDARRMVRQNAVRIDGERVEDEGLTLGSRGEPYTIQVGKRSWASVKIQK